MKNFRCTLLTLFLFVFMHASHAGTLVQFHFFLGVNTYLGEVDVELYDQDKPVTTQNFIRLIEAGAYQNSFFHRCVPGFVLQGGGYYAVNPFATNLIAPPYGNLGGVGNFGNITNEINVGKFYSNTNWTIAMAKTSDPNSANSQFFFNLANNAASLDSPTNSGGFTVFGHAITATNYVNGQSGTNILNFFNTLYYGYGLVDLSQTYGTNGIFTQLPNSQISDSPPPYDDLVYYTITLLSAQLSIQTNGARQITWNSSYGFTNMVQYATNFPPTWQTLTNVMGNGNAMTATDTTTSKMRLYRVLVSY